MDEDDRGRVAPAGAAGAGANAVSGVTAAAGIGQRLREARTGKGLDLPEIAGMTRIPIRHLEAIERGDFSGLPGQTYAVGFVKSFARAVGLDADDAAQQVRDELDDDPRGTATLSATLPMDPARVPPRLLAWSALLIGILLVAAYLAFRHFGVADEAVAPAPDASVATPVQPRPAPAAAPADAAVVLTATDALWLRVYDASGTRLLEKEMAKGERFEVPPSAVKPMILTGRPDALLVTVGGRPVPPLGTAERAIKDVEISAAALLARPAPVSSPPPAAAAAGRTAVPASSPVRRAPAAPDGSAPPSTGTPSAGTTANDTPATDRPGAAAATTGGGLD